MPEGLWEKCDSCGAVLYRPELEENLEVCPKCSHHMPIRARARLAAFLDAGQHASRSAPTSARSTCCKFKDQKKYADRIKAAQKSTGERDALIAMQGMLKGRRPGRLRVRFRLHGRLDGLGGRRALRARPPKRALEIGCPLVCFSATGGARMQESLFSLMQMAKTSAALGRLRAAGLPYISVLTHPTTGGVSASLAMLGDINIAEPEALIGFAGPRVIEQTVRETLPEGFQRSEFLVEHGAIDQICDRREMRDRLAAPAGDDDAAAATRHGRRRGRLDGA